MPDPKNARLMLKMARKDLSALGGMLSTEVFADEVFGFHAQQAVEKAFKAWLCVLSDEVPRTHDLEQLSQLLIAAGADFLPEFLELIDLTDFAVIFRYGEFELDANINRTAVLEQVTELVEHVETIVGPA